MSETDADLGSKSMNSPAVSSATVSRLALYLRELQEMDRSGVDTVKSKTLGHHLGLTDAQVRRDLSIFGNFGKRGIGYPVKALSRAIRQIMGTDRKWDVILVGVGNLGRALCGYRGFGEQSFHLVAIFDSDPAKVGLEVAGVQVRSLDRLEATLASQPVQLGMMAVPAEAAQSVAERLADAGIGGILNFAPIQVKLKRTGTAVVNVDMALELHRLAFAVVNGQRNR